MDRARRLNRARLLAEEVGGELELLEVHHEEAAAHVHRVDDAQLGAREKQHLRRQRRYSTVATVTRTFLESSLDGALLVPRPSALPSTALASTLDTRRLGRAVPAAARHTRPTTLDSSSRN